MEFAQPDATWPSPSPSGQNNSTLSPSPADGGAGGTVELDPSPPGAFSFFVGEDSGASVKSSGSIAAVVANTAAAPARPKAASWTCRSDSIVYVRPMLSVDDSAPAS